MEGDEPLWERVELDEYSTENSSTQLFLHFVNVLVLLFASGWGRDSQKPVIANFHTLKINYRKTSKLTASKSFIPGIFDLFHFTSEGPEAQT